MKILKSLPQVRHAMILMNLEKLGILRVNDALTKNDHGVQKQDYVHEITYMFLFYILILSYAFQRYCM